LGGGGAGEGEYGHRRDVLHDPGIGKAGAQFGTALQVSQYQRLIANKCTEFDKI
jgi:hypothetical protein